MFINQDPGSRIQDSVRCRNFGTQSFGTCRAAGLTGETTSHSTRLPKNANQVAGYQSLVTSVAVVASATGTAASIPSSLWLDTDCLLLVRPTPRGWNSRSCQVGISLVELTLFIMIVSIALTGIMLVMNQTAGHSGDALMRKQVQAAAESLLEEIEAHAASGVYPCATPSANSARTNFKTVCDYNGYTTSGVLDIAGSGVHGLGNYNVAVAVSSSVLGNVPQGSAVQITVTVTPPAGTEAVSGIYVTGYRTAY